MNSDQILELIIGGLFCFYLLWILCVVVGALFIGADINFEVHRPYFVNVNKTPPKWWQFRESNGFSDLSKPYEFLYANFIKSVAYEDSKFKNLDISDYPIVDLSLYDCTLDSLKNLEKTKLERLILSRCKTPANLSKLFVNTLYFQPKKSVKNILFPSNLVRLTIARIKHPDIDDLLLNLPKTLRHLSLQDTLAKNLTNLPEDLETLFIVNTLVDNLRNLPSNLKYIDCSRCKNIKTLLGMPQNATTLLCSNTRITSLEGISKKLCCFVCHDSKVASLKHLSWGLHSLHCSNSKLLSLDFLPLSVRILTCHGNRFTDGGLCKILNAHYSLGDIHAYLSAKKVLKFQRGLAKLKQVMGLGGLKHLIAKKRHSF